MKLKNLTHGEKRRFFVRALPFLLIAAVLQMAAESSGYVATAVVIKFAIGIFGIFFLYLLFSKTAATITPDTQKPAPNQNQK